MNLLQKAYPVAWVLASVLLAGCPGGGNNSSGGSETPAQTQTRSFDVTVTNLTAAQPMSPLAVALHQPSLSLFAVGAPASAALEQLAEAGDNGALLTELAGADATWASAGGTGLLPPGGRETVGLVAVLAAPDTAHVSLSVVTMLVNTNDAVAAIGGLDVTNLALGDSMTLTGIAYDAGTEANSETADTVPGPAAGGGLQEGFNAARDDLDKVLMHSGVITQAEGLAASALTEVHKFDNPVLRVTVVRTQ